MEGVFCQTSYFLSMQIKECPSCAMEIDNRSKICPVCGYEFAYSRSMAGWVAILLVTIFLTSLILGFVLFL